ncbi:MAG: NTP transferase domain-containing protein, partial [Phycisphaerales bacterium]|nr:NTP transferase domain-containing protein [Phycisphaerales bacterium]
MRDSATSSRPSAAIILAAGKGTRMAGDLPKVVHPVADAPMVKWVVDAVRAAGVQRIIVVVGYHAQDVKDVFAADDGIEYVMQHEQHGTGHAVDVCRSAMADFDGDTFVLAGDGPLIRSETLCIMQQVHHANDAAATLATSVIDDPTGYGRIVRDSHGRFQAIVEHKNATDEQRAIHEVYPSYALFDNHSLFAQLECL